MRQREQDTFEDPQAFDPIAHRRWDSQGKESCIRLLKSECGIRGMRTDEFTAEHLNRMLPAMQNYRFVDKILKKKSGEMTKDLTQIDLEIDLMLDNWDGKIIGLMDVEIRVSWTSQTSCPFLEQFYIVDRKEKYFKRYYPYETFFLTFNVFQNLAILVYEKDIPQKKTLMIHPRTNRPGTEYGYLIPSEKIYMFYGDWYDYTWINELRNREINDPRIRCIQYYKNPAAASISYWKNRRKQ